MEKRVYTSSEMAMAKDCANRWQLRYLLGWRSKNPSPSAGIGWTLHEGLKLFHENNNRFPEKTPEQIWEKHVLGNPNVGVDELKLAFKECLTILKHYAVHYKGHHLIAAPHPKDRNIKLVEIEFRVPIVAPSGYPSSKFEMAGKVDLVELDENREYWIVDHKSRALLDKNSGARLAIDQQMRAYTWALSYYLGINIVGAKYNMIKRAVPKSPSRNKDGRISKKSCDTTLDLWMQEFNRVQEEQKQNDGKLMELSDYSKILDGLENKKFFHMAERRYSPDDIARIQYELWHQAKEMARMESHGFFPKNDSACDHWGGCRHKHLCMGLPPEDHLYELFDGQHAELDGNGIHAPIGKPIKRTLPHSQYAGSFIEMIEEITS